MRTDADGRPLSRTARYHRLVVFSNFTLLAIFSPLLSTSLFSLCIYNAVVATPVMGNMRLRGIINCACLGATLETNTQPAAVEHGEGTFHTADQNTGCDGEHGANIEFYTVPDRAHS